MSVIGSNILAGASGQGGGYNLTRSLRFRSSASAYLNRTPASAGNRQIFTYSVWAKRGKLGAWQDLLSAGVTTANNPRVDWTFNNNDSIEIDMNSSGTAWDCLLTTTAVYRDPSAWYHVVVAVDTTQATASNRVKLYVNGSQITSFSSSTYPAQNANMPINNTIPHGIGNYIVGSSQYYDGLFTEVNFIDGQALTPSSFGETSSTTGVWQPKKYSGSYGTNGFYLPFTDNSALTTSSNVGLGKDFSGNGNYWATNNISITSGSTYDSMTDVPTLTSATASNYCVLNPLNAKLPNTTITNGNLKFTKSAASTFSIIYGSQGVSTGKWYFEANIVSRYFYLSLGFYNGSAGPSTDADSDNARYQLEGGTISKSVNGTSSVVATGKATSNGLIGIAIDCDAGEVSFYHNNTLQATATGLRTNQTYFPRIYVDGESNYSEVDFNFGQRPFAYTPPTGFVALNTFNLPTPTIGATASTQANKYMDISLYTGNASALTVSGLGFSPDLVWIKPRDLAYQHQWYDTVRGALKRIGSSSSNAENTETETLKTFTSNGFTLGNDVGTNPASPVVAWNWNAGGSTVTNTSGSISSQVRANTSSGFSIVTYTGNGSAGATVGHGLGVAPKMVIVKNRANSGTNWSVYTAMTGATNLLRLNSTLASTASSVFWNDTAPTSTVFSIGTDSDVNSNGNGLVAYCFSEVAGYSKFGSYTGNGSSTNGPFVYTGFKPRYVMVKRTDSADVWLILDAARNTYNVVGNFLQAQSSDAEGSVALFDFLSNGFKLRTSTNPNDNAANYIYMAFAENPFKYSNAR